MAEVDDKRFLDRNSGKTVCIVLDNPDRDLLGIGLLSSMLARKGIEVVVVPMYEQQQHVVKLMPDMVLVNYARRANSAAIRRYKKLGIRVGVLDTEGGVLRCEYKELLNIVLNSGVKDYIDDYFLWGTRQYEAFQKHLDSVNTSLYLTGCPRFDLYSEKWSHLIPRLESIDGDYILIATSFSFNNPRFASREREIENMRETMGLDRSSLEAMQVRADCALHGMISLFRRTCDRYRDMIFVLRPHPFESERIYVDALSDLNNLVIRRDGTMIAWLKYAAALIQLNSSSAFEARLLGKPVVSPEFFQDDSLRVPVASDSSIGVHSEEEYWEVLDHLIAGRYSQEVENRLEKCKNRLDRLVIDWVYRNDGMSSERVAEKMETILSEATERNEGWGWVAKAFYDYVYVHAYYIVKCIMGALLRNRRYGNRGLKSFTSADFQPIMSRLEEQQIKLADAPIYGKIGFCKSNAVMIKGELYQDQGKGSGPGNKSGTRIKSGGNGGK